MDSDFIFGAVIFGALVGLAVYAAKRRRGGKGEGTGSFDRNDPPTQQK